MSGRTQGVKHEFEGPLEDSRYRCKRCDARIRGSENLSKHFRSAKCAVRSLYFAVLLWVWHERGYRASSFRFDNPRAPALTV
jgi:hypothetical protein